MQRDLERLLASAVMQVAQDLVADGVADEAWADGTVLHVQLGGYTLVVRNHGAVGRPQTREEMLEQFARMVVQNLIRSKMPMEHQSASDGDPSASKS